MDRNQMEISSFGCTWRMLYFFSFTISRVAVCRVLWSVFPSGWRSAVQSALLCWDETEQAGHLRALQYSTSCSCHIIGKHVWPNTSGIHVCSNHPAASCFTCFRRMTLFMHWVVQAFSILLHLFFSPSGTILPFLIIYSSRFGDSLMLFTLCCSFWMSSSENPS